MSARITASFAFAFAIAIAGNASAASFSIIAPVDATQLELAAQGSVDIPGAWAAPGSTPSIRTGTVGGQQKSPFEGLGAGEFEDIEFFAVGSRHNTSEAIMTFAQVMRAGSFLWGSMDGVGPNNVGNRVTFLLDGVVKGDFVGTVLPGHSSTATPVVAFDDPNFLFNPNGFGSTTAWFSFAGPFNEIRFASVNNAFEFSSLTATPVPLPLTGVLLVSGLAALGFAGRQARR